MSRLIKLPGNENRYVAADQVSGVEPSYHRTHIVVSLKNGTVYNCEPDYGDAIYAAVDKLAAEVNQALEAPNG